MKSNKKISRKEALRKLESYGKYSAITALGTFLILSPKKAQASSPEPPESGNF